MTKIISSKFKASRRLGTSLWGDSKDAFLKKNYRPGQHGQNPLSKNSDYGIHLKAKQRLKNHYGRIGEKQFRNIFKLASKMKGNTGENLVGLLERRLDAIVYRLTLAPTPFSARQLVSHGHIKVNGKRVDIASQRLKEGDVIELKEASKQMPLIMGSIVKNIRSVPLYLNFDANLMSGKFIKIPNTSEVPYPFMPDIHLVVELYSR